MRAFRILTLATMLPTVALAEREITPLVGLRQGSVEFSTGIGCVTLEGVKCPFFGKSDESAAVGVLVDVPVAKRLDVEVLVNRQPTEIIFHDGNEEVPRRPGSGRSDFDVTHLQAGLRRTWEFGRTQPFVAFGAGLTMLESEPLLAGSIDTTRGSVSLAGGARVRLAERLGLRLEARAYRVDLPTSFGNDQNRIGDDNLDQSEFTTGLAVRF